MSELQNQIKTLHSELAKMKIDGVVALELEKGQLQSQIRKLE